MFDVSAPDGERMQLLITGGAGFIGSNLARMALTRGHRVRVLDDLSTGRRSNLNGLDVDLIEASTLDYKAVLKSMTGADGVVHLAAIPSVPRSVANPRASHEANTTGTLNVLEATRETGVSHLSVASSSSVYGANPKLPKSEFDYTRPMSPYAVSKQATEGYALAYQFSYGLPTVAFRFFNVYGPGQPADHDYAAVIPKFLDAALHGRRATVYGDGTQSRDFTFVDTVCSVLLEAAERTVISTDPVNLAFQTNTSLLELLDLMEKQLGGPVAREFTERRVGDVKASQADCSRVTELFGDVVPVSLEDGLKKTIEWMKGRDQ